MEIGGKNKVVEIDESKFGIRKYNRGHKIEGQWVFGGVERGSGKFFLVPVEDRTKVTLLPIIKKFILPGTTIMSDCWKPYNELKNMGYVHQTVNHSKNFVDPATGACTNQIEGLWRHAKHRVPEYRRQKQQFTGYLSKYMFLSKAKKEGKEPIEEFLKHAAVVYTKYGLNFS